MWNVCEQAIVHADAHGSATIVGAAAVDGLSSSFAYSPSGSRGDTLKNVKFTPPMVEVVALFFQTLLDVTGRQVRYMFLLLSCSVVHVGASCESLFYCLVTAFFTP